MPNFATQELHMYEHLKIYASLYFMGSTWNKIVVKCYWHILNAVNREHHYKITI